MTAKKKAPPKKKAVKKKVVKKHAAKKKAPARKKAASRSKQSALPHKSSKAPAKRGPAKPKVPAKKKVRARTRRLGPIPKYHINHQSWDKEKVMGVICEKLMQSSSGIAYICRDDKELPCISIVNKWMADENAAGGDKPLLDMYARAKAMQIDYQVDETVEISDNQAGQPVVIDGVPVVVDGKLMMQVDSASVQHAKLRIESRRWVAEKLAHRKYGNKLEIAGDPERPLSTVSDDDLDARIALLQKKADELNQS